MVTPHLLPTSLLSQFTWGVLSSRAHSEVFIGVNLVRLHYSPTSRATRHSLMESQHASKLLIPLLTVGFMAPPREAVLENVAVTSQQQPSGL